MHRLYAVRLFLMLGCVASTARVHTQSLRLNEFLASNHSILADAFGAFDDWVEIYNPGTDSVDLAGSYISDNASNPQKWQIPATDPQATMIAPGGYLLLWLDDAPEEGATHLPFKLDAGGEDLLLSAPDGSMLDQWSFGPQTTDISLARLPDGTGIWTFCSSPTPGLSNSFSSAVPLTDTPLASMSSGRFDAGFQLAFSSGTPGAQIRFTFDGTVPDENDALYTEALVIQSTTVVRARVFAPNYLPGGVSENSYLFVPAHTFPIVSLVFDPADFFDSLSGIYNHPLSFSEVEVPVHATWLEPDGSIGFDADLGAELFGSGSITLPQKSLLLKAKAGFGASEIEHAVFPQLPENEYKSLILRNSGQDWGITMFRDALVGSLARDLDDVRPITGDLPLTFQAFRPAVVYLNGAYWGIHNVREQHNKHFLKQHFDLDEDESDFIEFYGTALEGDSIAWQTFWQWVSDHHFESDSKFKELANRNDMPNFTDYCIFQIASDNVDWPGKNWRRFRPRTDDGRWHWLPYDFDLSFGLMNTDFSWNTGFAGQNAFTRAIDSTFSHWASADWQTLLLRRSLENLSYRHYFLNRTADLLNTVFEKGRILTRIDSFENMYLPEIDLHYQRWFFSEGWVPYWMDNVQKMRDFASSRADFCFQHAMTTFPEAQQAAMITLAVEPPEAGELFVSTLHLDTAQLPWQGRYFEGVPVPVKAVAKPGWTFSGWSQPELGNSDSTTFWPMQGLALTAYFTPDSVPLHTTDLQRADFQISPNPASHFVQLRSGLPIRQVFVYDALGRAQQVLDFQQTKPTTTLLPVQHWNPGVYWVKVLLESGEPLLRRLVKY